MQRKFVEWSHIEATFEKKTPLERVDLTWNASAAPGDLVVRRILPLCSDDEVYARTKAYAEHVALQRSFWSSDAGFPSTIALLMHGRGEKTPPEYDRFLSLTLQKPGNQEQALCELIRALPSERRAEVLKRRHYAIYVAPATEQLLKYFPADEVLPALLARMGEVKGRLTDYDRGKYLKAIGHLSDVDFLRVTRALFGAKLGTKPARVLLEASLTRPVDEALTELLVCMLGHGNKGVREAVESRLEDIGAPAAAALVAGAKHKKKSIRETCARVVAKRGAEPVPLPDALTELARGEGDQPVLALYAARDMLKAGTYQAYSDWSRILREASGSGHRSLAWAALAGFLSWPSNTQKFSTNQLKRALAGLPRAVEPIRWALRTGDSAHEAVLHEVLAKMEGADAASDVWLPALKSRSKLSRSLAVEQLAKVEENLSEAILPLLSERKKDVRIVAAQLLMTHLPSDPAPLRAVLDKEKVLEVATSLEAALSKMGGDAPSKKAASVVETVGTTGAPADLLAALASTRKKKAPKWLGELPPLRLADGTPVEGDALAGLLARLSLEGADHHDELLAGADFDGVDFSLAILDAWQKGGKGGARDAGSGPSAHKWAVYQQVFFVDDARIVELGEHITRWGSNNHHLASWNLEWLSRRSGAAADEAIARVAVFGGEGKVAKDAKSRLDARAKAEGAPASALVARASFVEPVELKTYTLPANYFPSGGMKIDYGARQFSGRFDAKGTLQAYDADGKLLKALPKPGKRDAPEAKAARATFMDKRKAYKKVTTTQIHKLEALMIGRQRFPLKLFKLCFLEDALLSALGRGIIFRSASGALCRPEQGELLTADFDVFTPSRDDVFTIPHPLEMSDAEKLAWGAHVADSELLQPFHQLSRRTFALKTKPTEVKGINHRAFSAMLESYGYRPQKGDEYGGVEGAIKRFPARKGQIVIAHSAIGPYINDPVDVYSVHWQDLLGGRPTKPDPIGFSEACFDVLRMSGAAL